MRNKTASFETTTTVARRIGCSEQWVRILHARGDLPGLRTATGHLLFLAADVERVVADRAQRQERAAQ